MFRHLLAVLVVDILVAHSLCAEERALLPDYVVDEFGDPPVIPSGPLSASLQSALEDVLDLSFAQATWNANSMKAFDRIAHAKDPRVIWTLVDIQRFAWQPDFRAAITRTAEKITGKRYVGGRQRADIIDTMLAWDMPAYPGYLAHKKRVFTNYVPGWERIFVEGDIEWQLVDWGGVNIDARPFDRTDEACNNCIPAADNPTVENAFEAKWLKDDDIVYGIVINGEARAYPRRIMEIREMVNDTLGGRDFALPYCSLCGAAQGYFTDELPIGVARPVMRTTGLLIRSNKVMYDVVTYSVFDTFLGRAVTGALADIGLELERVTVITSDWAAWRAAYPETTVLVEDLALGRDFNLRETRDANGPIFPVGDVDPRLPVLEDVIGVLSSNGQAIAFPRAKALAALSAGRAVESGGVTLERFAGGIRAVGSNGEDLGSHEAFWFAWAQFHPRTSLWSGANVSASDG